jgi:hypothetical protein
MGLANQIRVRRLFGPHVGRQLPNNLKRLGAVAKWRLGQWHRAHVGQYVDKFDKA